MHFPILSSIVALPVAGAILLLFVRGDEERSAPLARNVALVVSLLVFAETLLLWIRFNTASGDFQFVERHAWIPAFGIEYFVGVDGISLLLLVLTGFGRWRCSARGNRCTSRPRRSASSCCARERDDGRVHLLDLFPFLLLGRDAGADFFLIGIWGYERRIYAAIKFILYTMAGSVLMLLAILGLACALHRDRTYSFDLLKRGCRCRPPVLVLPGVRARLRSRCRCSRSTPGCLMRTSRRRPPVR
jgi:NADH-quinone oxidoreductase subunit M